MNKIILSIIIYLFLAITITMSKPKIFYDNMQELKPFGTGPGKTIVPLWLILMIVAILSYLFVLFYY